MLFCYVSIALFDSGLFCAVLCLAVLCCSVLFWFVLFCSVLFIAGFSLLCYGVCFSPLLLIVSALAQSDLLQLHGLAVSLGMDVLIEVHDKEELDRALVLDNSLIGINNRNLHSFEVSLDNTFRLLDDIPKEIMVVTESGIATRADVSFMREKQVHGFLVGEAFMRSADPGEKLKELFF